MRKKVSILLRIVPLLSGCTLMVFVFGSSKTGMHVTTGMQSDFVDFEVTREPRVGSARISTVTGQKAAITIYADTVSSRFLIMESEPISLNLQNPIGNIQFPAGDIVWFSGNVGEIDEIGDFVYLEGDVKVRTSDGYVAKMDFLQSNLESTLIEGKGNVEGFGPVGTVSSNEFKIYPDSSDSGSYLLLFSGDVFVVYWPE